MGEFEPPHAAGGARVLVAGARGFVGTALVPALRATGSTVVAGVRPGFDVDDDTSVARALRGVSCAVWLVHGLRRGARYPTWERDVAARFAQACRRAGVERIVYLGGLRLPGPSSRHLLSRNATGDALRSAGVDVVELRAGMIVGARSQSFLIARDAAARLPVVLAPPWLFAPQQPVALDDVVAALAAACDPRRLEAGAFDVPGPEILTGAEIVSRTARLLGRAPPRFIRVPFFPRTLAGRLTPLVTRADPRVAHALFAGMGFDLTSDGDGVFARLPGHRRLGFDEAVRRALAGDRVPLPGRLVEAAVRSLGRSALLAGGRGQ